MFNAIPICRKFDEHERVAACCRAFCREGKSSEIITVYWGGDIKEPDAGTFRDRIHQRFANAEVELVFGGQPFYEYIISVE